MYTRQDYVKYLKFLEQTRLSEKRNITWNNKHDNVEQAE